MKKHRGKKKYFKQLATDNDFIKRTKWLDFNTKDLFFDYWHLHFDPYAYGDKSFKRRLPHLDKLIRHYDLASEKMKNTQLPFQLWIFINDFTSYNDGLYFHTPNPNADNYPHKYSELGTKPSLKNQALQGYLAKKTDFIILYNQHNDPTFENFCVLIKDTIGSPIK